MNKKARLIYLSFSLLLLLVIGRIITGSFLFAITHFWFTSGLFLLLFLSLIDQPHYSKDSNIFINSITGWMSLMLIPFNERDWIWWSFFGITTYLIVSSYLLIWIRKKDLDHESKIIVLLTRLNREIGKPETLFSTFFLWGAVRQFGLNTVQFDALLLYWVVFMILNLPSFSAAISSLFVRKPASSFQVGEITKLIDPRVAETILPMEFPDNQVGRAVNILSPDKEVIGKGIIIDERIVFGARTAKIAITESTSNWKKVSNNIRGKSSVLLLDSKLEKGIPISIVDKGSTIDQLVFYLNPNRILVDGEILYVTNDNKVNVFYQITSAIIVEEPANDGNFIQSVKVTASQLGIWIEETNKFYPYSWVPPTGQLIYQGKDFEIKTKLLTNDFSIVGTVPNSKFPVHTRLEDIVTHNTAIIGVTGSGKSYLSFHLIESLLKAEIKVLILDLTREHYQYLSRYSPYTLRKPEEVKVWLGSKEPLLAIHQYADSISLPGTTFNYTKEAFEFLSANTKLTAGKNLPARVCIVYEEAHSLIPEWNQVLVQSDTNHVNSTARTILQGRKLGLGCIIVTQRTANVTKTILNQCNTIFALQSFDQTGLDFLKNYMGEEYAGTLSRLPPRQAILVGKASSSQKPIIFEISDFTERWKSSEKEEKANS